MGNTPSQEADNLPALPVQRIINAANGEEVERERRRREANVPAPKVTKAYRPPVTLLSATLRDGSLLNAIQTGGPSASGVRNRGGDAATGGFSPSRRGSAGTTNLLFEAELQPKKNYDLSQLTASLYVLPRMEGGGVDVGGAGEERRASQNRTDSDNGAIEMSDMGNKGKATDYPTLAPDEHAAYARDREPLQITRAEGGKLIVRSRVPINLRQWSPSLFVSR